MEIPQNINNAEALPKGFIIKKNEPALIVIELSQTTTENIKGTGFTPRAYLEDSIQAIKKSLEANGKRLPDFQVTDENTLEIKPVDVSTQFNESDVSAIEEKLQYLNSSF